MVEHVTGRQAAHPDQPVDDHAFPAEPQPPTGIHAQRHDAQVDVGSKTAVQAHFSVAIAASGSERARIEGSEADRFLELVGVVVGQEHPGHVGFDRVDAPDRFGTARRARQEGKLGASVDLPGCGLPIRQHTMRAQDWRCSGCDGELGSRRCW